MLLTQEELKQSANLDPEVAKFFAAHPAPSVDWSKHEEHRAMIDMVTGFVLSQLDPLEDDLLEYDLQIPMRDGYVNTGRLFSRRTQKSDRPLIVNFFGGGWISGKPVMMTPFCRAWVRLFDAVVVAPDYRLAPEHKFPTSQLDAWDTMKWLDLHAGELGVDLRQGFVVAGVSAGAGNTAACVAQSLLEPLQHPFTGQYLCTPSVMDEESVPLEYKSYHVSLQQNRDAPGLTAAALHELHKHTSWDVRSPWRFAVLSEAPLSKYPPTYSQVDGLDPLRDDGLIWDEMLKRAGVSTRLDFYPGCPHAHFFFMPGLDVTNKAIADMMIGVGWLLGNTVTAEEGLAAMGP